MARREAEREDLWAEAIAMTSRAELVVDGEPQPILVGFRDNGWCSIYIGQDVMLQFTPDGSLRRVYRHGELYRTQGTTLARLRRQRSAEETTLLRDDLTSDELEAFRAWTSETISEFLAQISAGRVAVRREINLRPGRLLDDVLAMLRRILTADRFLAPAIPGKR